MVGEAIGGVVVYHADGLHEGINDGRSDELETHFLEIFAYPIRKWGTGRHIFKAFPVPRDGFVIHIAPYHFVKASVLFCGF